MIIPQVTHFILRQPQSTIPIPPLPLLILHPQPQHKPHHEHRRHDQQCQTDRKARSIERRLRSREDETRDDTARVPQPDLEPRGDSGLVLAAHVVRQHRPEQRQRDVRSSLDEIEGGVFDTLANLPLVQQDDEADEAEQVPEFRKGKAMSQAVGEVSGRKREEAGNDEDGDDEDLDVAG